MTLHIYLANSLLVPRGTADLFESNFQIAVDNKRYVLNLKGIAAGDDFDQLITFCDDLVGRYPDPLERPHFIRLLRPRITKEHSEDLPGQLFDIYRGMKVAHSQGRDIIWKFILQNSYKPVFLMNRFDFVVGNPPWLTYAAVSNGEYQGLLKQLSDGYSVTPFAKANMPHLEIAAIFLAHAVNYFLKPSGGLAFVLPRSFLSADQHDNTRQGLIEGIKLSKIWDLEGVSPLFRVPSCVLFAVRSSKKQPERSISAGGLPGLSFVGQLPRSKTHWDDATDKLTQTARRWHYSRLQGGKGAARSALTAEARVGSLGANAYSTRFSQGATIVPRNFFFVDLDQKVPDGEDLSTRVVALRSAAAAEREAKKPWKGQLIKGRAEGKLLFRTAISRNIIPFALIDPPLVLLPVILNADGNGREQFKVLSAEGLLERGYRYGNAWFFDTEGRWDASKTDKNREMEITLARYLNWQNKLSDQNPKARYLVLYTSSATDASATVIDRRTFDHPFIVDHKTYWCECTSEAEAHYLAAYVNSGYANGMIKEFQSRGLFGPRDIHKLIVKLPFPKYEKRNVAHDELSVLGKACAKLAGNFVRSIVVQDLEARTLGRARSALRDELAYELDKIDLIVETLSTGKSVIAGSPRRKSRRTGGGMGRLFD